MQTYTLENGAKITFPKSELGNFLHQLYLELFQRRRNVSRILEAIAGRDVRRALEMFVSIITSGHLSEAAITSKVKGAGTVPITEYNILKILMRTDYRLYSDTSGFVTNIFAFENQWQKPDNFLLVEILYYLARHRKLTGQIGLEGYFSCQHVANELQKMGYVPEDTLAAANRLLQKHLLAADHMNFASVGFDDSIKIQASGFMHIRVLSERLEYLYGILATTPIIEPATAKTLAEFVQRESQHDGISATDKHRAVEIFRKYIEYQKVVVRDKTPFTNTRDSGASYVLERISEATRRFKENDRVHEANLLDI